jgi:hypothetical protein
MTVAGSAVARKGVEVKRPLVCLFQLLLLVSLAGCVPLVVGAAAGGLGGYAISNDTIQGERDNSYERLWGSAVRVSAVRGTIKREDKLKGCIDLDVDSGKAWVRLIRVTRATTRLKVAARKHHLPDLSLAQDMFVKIMDGAK